MFSVIRVLEGSWNLEYTDRGYGRTGIGDGRFNETALMSILSMNLAFLFLAMGLHDVVISASPEGILFLIRSRAVT